MTKGEKLKVELGLSKFKYVKISRALITSRPVYLIFFDSFRPNVPIVNYNIENFPHTFRIYLGQDGFDKMPVMTPPLDIEDFNSSKSSGIFCLIDIAGQKYINKKLTKDIKYESVILKDLAKNQGMSDFTLEFRKKRNKVGQRENLVAKLTNVEINKPDNSVTFTWETPPTKNEEKPKMKVDPEMNFKLVPADRYTLQIKILDFFDWLDTNPDITIIKAKDIKEILEVSNVKLWSNAPSDWWQGIVWNLTQLDGAIYPCNIKPKRWNAKHLHNEEGFLGKHLGGLVNQMSFFYNPMASTLSKRLRDGGYLNNE
ncbi:MAG: hypothetical protein GF311_28190 [Candidatus Lokiarchaeota archaeon]|nr:hypothetical protein [Candidatus Lokiarchaeota archaeon]